MSRWLLRLLVVVLGFLAGAGAVLMLQESPGAERTEPRFAVPSPEAPSTPTPRAFAKAGPAPEPSERLLLAWTPGGLPGGFAEDVTSVSGVEQVTAVQGGLLELTGSWDADGQQVDELEDGWVIPLDAVAVDPATYPPFVSKSVAPVIGGLADDEALLSETGAELRGLGEGARLAFHDGPTLTVAAVVDDAHVGGAELAVTAGTAEGTPAGVGRYVLLTYTRDRAEVEQGVRALLPNGPAVRLRGPGETPVLRHGDAVLTQAEIKERFGEFAYRRAGGRGIEQDADWVAAHLETAEVPILGRVRCHRAVLPALEGALAELEREHLAHTLDPTGFAGCHAARFTTSLQSVSRHAWGVAFDVNVDDNPVGQESAQDPRLVEALERWGFTWGGPWLVPDPAHFEYVRPPAPDVQTGGE